MSGHDSAQLHPAQLFTIAFGTIAGIAWVFLAGPWLRTAGPLGTVIGLTLGGALMLPVVWCYALLADRYPGAGGELLYVGHTLGTWPGMLAGWLLALAYIALVAFHLVTVTWLVDVCLERVSVLTGHPAIFSQYAGFAVSAALFCGVVLANCRGVATASRLQDVVVVALALATLAFAANAFRIGRAGYMVPYFGGGNGPAYQGVLRVIATAPFLYGGFGTAVQAVSDLRSDRPCPTLRILGCAVMGAALFYAIIVLSVACVLPREDLLKYPLPALDAFSAGFHSPLATIVVGCVALIALSTSWNGVFLGAWKIVAALADRHFLPRFLGRNEQRENLPYGAVLFVTATSIALAGRGRVGLLGIVTSVAFMIAVIFLLMTSGTLRSLINKGHRPPYRDAWKLGVAVAAVGVAVAVVVLAGANLRESPTSVSDIWVLALCGIAFVLQGLLRRRLVVGFADTTGHSQSPHRI
jgi:basic amino acid/polyamine antiporter, APA family